MRFIKKHKLERLIDHAKAEKEIAKNKKAALQGSHYHDLSKEYGKLAEDYDFLIVQLETEKKRK